MAVVAIAVPAPIKRDPIYTHIILYYPRRFPVLNSCDVPTMQRAIWKTTRLRIILRDFSIKVTGAATKKPIPPRV